MTTEIQNLYDNFGQAMTGDLRWVLIALIALILGTVYAAAISGDVHPDELEADD